MHGEEFYYEQSKKKDDFTGNTKEKKNNLPMSLTSFETYIIK